MTIAYPWEPASLDPFITGGDSPATRDIVRLVMPALWRVLPGNVREPWLIAGEPEEISGPPFTVRLSLRDDAVWSDGRPITAADLRATWVRARAGPRAVREGFDAIRRIVGETPKRARIEFTRPYRRWRDLFSGGLGIIPAHVPRYAAWRVSGGPFVLRRWNAGLDIRLVRNRRAWGATPALDSIRIVFVPDSEGALELFRTRKVDVLGPYVTSERARRAAGATFETDRGGTWTGLVMNVSAGPLREVAVRRALASAIDRGRIVRGLVAGEGAPLTVPDGTAETEVFPPFRQGAAEEQLDRAGWRGSPVRRKGGKRLSFTLAVVGQDDLTAIVARAIQYQATVAGFDIEAVALEPEIFWRDWLPGSRFQAALVVWRDPPDGALARRFSRPGNVARLSDSGLDRLLTAADAPGGNDARERALGRLATLMPAIPLLLVNVGLAFHDSVCGVEVNASADGPFSNAGEWSRGPCS